MLPMVNLADAPEAGLRVEAITAALGGSGYAVARQKQLR